MAGPRQFMRVPTGPLPNAPTHAVAHLQNQICSIKPVRLIKLADAAKQELKMLHRHDFTDQGIADAATQALRGELYAEILTQDRSFVRRDGTLNPAAIYEWLQLVERDSDKVRHAAQETDASVWGLACFLAGALQPTIDSTYQLRELESAVKDMTHVHLFTNLMSFWQMRDESLEDDALADGLIARETLKEVGKADRRA